MHTVAIETQHGVCMYYHFQLLILRPLKFWLTTIHVMWDINNVEQSYPSAFGWQFTTCRSIPLFLIYIASLPHFFSYSSISLTSITYHLQLSQRSTRVPGLSCEFWSRMYQWIQYDCGYSCWDILHIDCSCYDWYDVTDLNFVSKFCHWLSFCFLPSQWQAKRYQIHLSAPSLIWSQDLLHGPYDSCTCIVTN